ncbi:ATP-binding cassette domain-containing protein, partial [Alloscardovia omnicolens]|uniref:ATP-binding cassette domain-containing protein n=2 Tax=Actinomycetes TaxID=1760 RepID=UPI00254A5A58
VVNVDVTFSGGEAQRVAIARSIVTDAPVLIFDEATAYADPASEALIQSAIERLARSRTVIVIAHRLSTIRNADRILVLDGGAVAEAGTHDELLA